MEISSLSAPLQDMPAHDRAPSHPPGPVFDRNALVEMVDDNLDFALQLVELFLEKLDGYMDAIREAIRGNSSRSLEGAAHDLTGALGTIHAIAAMEAAHRLVGMARRDDLAGASSGLAALENEVGRLHPVLSAFS